MIKSGFTLMLISVSLILKAQIWSFPGLAGTSWTSDSIRVDFMTVDDTIRVFHVNDTFVPVLKGVGRQNPRYIPFAGVLFNNRRIQQTQKRIVVRNGRNRWVFKQNLIGVPQGAMYIAELQAINARFKIKSRTLRINQLFRKR